MRSVRPVLRCAVRSVLRMPRVAVRLVAEDPAAPPLPTPAVGDLDGRHRPAPAALGVRAGHHRLDLPVHVRRGRLPALPQRLPGPLRRARAGPTPSTSCRPACSRKLRLPGCGQPVRRPRRGPGRPLGQGDHRVLRPGLTGRHGDGLSRAGSLRAGPGGRPVGPGLPNPARASTPPACTGAGDCRRAGPSAVVDGDGTARLTAPASRLRVPRGGLGRRGRPGADGRRRRPRGWPPWRPDSDRLGVGRRRDPVRGSWPWVWRCTDW